MRVIPKEAIGNVRETYAPESDIWEQYPELEAEREGLLHNLIRDDEKTVRDAAIGYGGTVIGRKPIYMATAGAPLAGKSTILEQELASMPEFRDKAYKVDPDRWVMSYMVRAYHGHMMAAGMVANAPDFQYAQRRAYDILRPASNIIATEILDQGTRCGCDVIHGTTSTGAHVPGMLEKLKEAGYQIDLLLCGAPDKMRGDAAAYRAEEQGYYQSTPEDVVNKGLLFPQRVSDYFKYADNLTIFWRDGVTKDAIRSAEYRNGKLQILDGAAYAAFVNKYEQDRSKLANPADPQHEPVILPAFEAIQASYQMRHGTLSDGFGLGFERFEP